MAPTFISIGTDGKVWVSSDPDQAFNVANASHVLEVVPVGHTPVLLATISGTGSPYTVTTGSVDSAQHVKVRK